MYVSSTTCYFNSIYIVCLTQFIAIFSVNMQLIFEFEKLQPNNFHDMKKGLIRLVSHLIPSMDVDSMASEDWAALFHVFQKELLKSKQPLFTILSVSPA